MIKVCFVCLGNICRSPMAELVFKDLAEKEGLSDKFEITSCGTSSCEAGSAIYPPIKRTLDSHRISGSHIARKITKTDLEDSDYILAMDGENIYELKCMSGGKYSDKLYKLCSFTDKPRDVADPWYTRDFERAYCDVFDGCRAFLEYLKREVL